MHHKYDRTENVLQHSSLGHIEGIDPWRTLGDDTDPDLWMQSVGMILKSTQMNKGVNLHDQYRKTLQMDYLATRKV